VEEAVQEPILALRMAGRVFPVGAEMASSLIVTFRKAVVLDGKRDGMLVDVLELGLPGVAADLGTEVDVEVRCSDSKIASTRRTSRSLRGSTARFVVGLETRETSGLGRTMLD